MGSPSNDMKSYATADKGITSLEEEHMPTDDEIQYGTNVTAYDTVQDSGNTKEIETI